MGGYNTDPAGVAAVVPVHKEYSVPGCVIPVPRKIPTSSDEFPSRFSRQLGTVSNAEAMRLLVREDLEIFISYAASLVECASLVQEKIGLEIGFCVDPVSRKRASM